MIKTDGSYPCSFDSRHGAWNYVAPLTLRAANAILIEVCEAAGEEITGFVDGRGHLLLNKCFRVYSADIAGGNGFKLWAVYNHDGDYYIISIDEHEAKNLRCWSVKSRSARWLS